MKLQSELKALKLPDRQWVQVDDTWVYRKGHGFIVLYELTYPFGYTSSFGPNHDDSYSGCLFGTDEKLLPDLDAVKKMIVKLHAEHTGRL